MSRPAYGDSVSTPDNFWGHRDELRERLSELPEDWPYDFLAPHQHEAVGAFREHALAIVERDIPNKGMSLDHAPGSGKSRTLAAMLRLVMSPSTSAVIFTPNSVIRGQVSSKNTRVLSDGEEDVKLSDYEEYLPGIRVNEYSPQHRYVSTGLVALNYQSLDSAIRRGDFGFIGPVVLAADEGHHLDARNTWRRQVESVMPGRLSVRMSATSGFRDNDVRSKEDLFPLRLGRLNIREGIRDDVLSEVYGFLYDSKVHIQLPDRKNDEDYSEDALFEAIANSPVNDMVMKICTQELEQGRQGIIQCVPGYDRAHSRILAAMLSNVRVRRPSGDKMKIRVAHVDGDMPKEEVRRIFALYEAGKLDILTHTSLIDEGFNSPETDFIILIPPTSSRKKLEQAIGRALRKREDKIATVHGFAYEMDDFDKPQVTIEDILGSNRAKNGVLYYGPETRHRQQDGRVRISLGKRFDIDAYSFDPLLLERRITGRDSTPTKRINITRDNAASNANVGEVQRVLSSDRQTRVAFAKQFRTTPENVTNIFADKGLTGQNEVVRGATLVTYGAAEGFAAMAEALNAKPISEKTDELTVDELCSMYQELDPKLRMTGATAEAAFSDAGVRPILFTDADKIIIAYPRSAANAPLEGRTRKRLVLRESERNLPYENMELRPEVAVVRWLNDVFEQNDERLSRSEIATGMQMMILALNGKLTTQSPYSVEAIREEVQRSRLKPTANMIKVMKKMNDISFQSLLYSAHKAYTHHTLLKNNQNE